MTRKRIVITGVAGFIGSNLADALVAAGHQVVGIDNLAYGLREQIPPRVQFHELDIRGRGVYDIIAGADALFHLAAKNCIADCQEDPVETCDINVTGTVNIFEAARIGKVRKVIYAESSALYEGSRSLPTAEDDVHPQSFYSVSKFAGMAFAEAYQRFHGMRMTGLRYFCVYGPRQDYRRSVPPVMSAFIMKLLEGQRPTIYGTGHKKRDFIYVDDVNAFHLLCLDDPRTDGQIYNLGSGQNYSITDIYREITDLLGVRIQPDYRPDMPGEAQETLADISKASRLGWEPRTTLIDGLKHSIDYIKKSVV